MNEASKTRALKSEEKHFAMLNRTEAARRGVSPKSIERVAVQALSGDDDVAGACDDAACFLREVRTGTALDDVEPMNASKRARSARWLAETALALALHFEAVAKELGEVSAEQAVINAAATVANEGVTGDGYNADVHVDPEDMSALRVALGAIGL